MIIPTYNEADNIGMIVTRLREAVPEAHVLVTDDNSPDGTGAIADDMAAHDDHIHVLHRQGKEGLSAAYLASFRWGGWTKATTCWSSTTPTAPTNPSSCRACWRRCAGGRTW